MRGRRSSAVPSSWPKISWTISVQKFFKRTAISCVICVICVIFLQKPAPTCPSVHSRSPCHHSSFITHHSFSLHPSPLTLPSRLCVMLASFASYPSPPKIYEAEQDNGSEIPPSKLTSKLRTIRRQPWFRLETRNSAPCPVRVICVPSFSFLLFASSPFPLGPAALFPRRRWPPFTYRLYFPLKGICCTDGSFASLASQPCATKTYKETMEKTPMNSSHSPKFAPFVFPLLHPRSSAFVGGFRFFPFLCALCDFAVNMVSYPCQLPRRAKAISAAHVSES